MSKPHVADWIIKDTADDVALLARDHIMEAAKQAIHERGAFKIVLAGGTTPMKVYALLAKEDCNWKRWFIYIGDERCLPIGNSERNSLIIKQLLLTQVNIPAENIYFINAEMGAEKAAKAYSKIVEKALPFDMVLLGMGEDGHTASLFPNHQHNQNEWVHAVFNAPKPPSERVSLSVKSLSHSKYLSVIVTGKTKNNAVTEWRQGKNLPVTQIGTLGKAEILLDRLAGQK